MTGRWSRDDRSRPMLNPCSWSAWVVWPDTASDVGRASGHAIQRWCRAWWRSDASGSVRPDAQGVRQVVANVR